MNLGSDFPVLLRIEAAAPADSLREEVLAVLLDYPVAAIHEVEDHDRLVWDVSFGDRGWAAGHGYPTPFFHPDQQPIETPLTGGWRRFPDLAELTAAVAGKQVERACGTAVRCVLRGDPYHWSLTNFEASHGMIRVGRFLIAPRWTFPDPDPTSIILRVNPSAGFGSGHHPSTRLILSVLQEIDCGGKTVLDVGTGSAILAMAAARLGASAVTAVDHDPSAIAGAVESLKHNRLSATVVVREADIRTQAIGAFDIVLANLDASDIVECRDSLLRHVKADGQLVIAGFLAVESDDLWQAIGGRPVIERQEEGWAAGVVQAETLCMPSG